VAREELKRLRTNQRNRSGKVGDAARNAKQKTPRLWVGDGEGKRRSNLLDCEKKSLFIYVNVF
jgi:hypothetical protein